MEQALRFLHKYFDVIIACNAILLSCLILTHFMLRIRQRPRPLQYVLRSSFYYVLLLGEVVLVLVTVYVLADNLRDKKPLDFSARVLGTTEWVKDPLQIFFISDKNLLTVRSDGKNRKILFSADDSLKSYHFSPDKKYLAIVSLKELFLYDLSHGKSRRVDTWKTATDSSYQGSIDGVAWSPQSDRMCYRLSRWTPFSSQEQWHIFDLKTGQGTIIKSPGRSLNALAWDASGENLYYSWFDALDKTTQGNPFQIKIFRIPLTTLTPELVLQFAFDQPSLTLEHMAIRGIPIYFPLLPLSFGQDQDYGNSWTSSKGSLLTIDESDHLTYMKNRWWRRRLFRVPRLPPTSDYSNGRLAIEHVTWFPSGRYVIMQHDFFGLLILEPSTAKIGILVNDKGQGLGWSEGILRSQIAKFPVGEQQKKRE